MPAGILFWVLMLLWFLFGLYWNWKPNDPPYWPIGGHLLLFFVIFLLGWKVFGPPLQ